MEALTNTKHCSQNFNNYSVQISLFLYSQYFGLGPDAARTQYLTHTAPNSSLSLWRRKLPRCFAAPLQALSLVSTRIGRWWTPESLAILPLSRRGMAPSPSAGRQLYRRENDSIAIRCLAVGCPPRHPFTASHWKDFYAIRFRTVTWLPRHPLDSYYIPVLSPGLRKENPRGENPVGRLSRYPLDYKALSHFWKVRHSSRQRYPSLSFEYTRKLWWSRTQECSISTVAVAWPFNWHVTSEASQVAYR